MWLANFFHTFQPQPIAFRLGLLTIHWYGLLIVLGGLAGFFLTLKLSKRYKIRKEIVENLIFYLIIFGLIGARIYHLLCELPYYFKNPLDILKIWQGGLGIYGAIAAGAIVLFFYGRKHNLSFLFLADLIAPALILGQAIGRWGNWFNRELYGLPTNSAWGIPIGLANRLGGFESCQYFHPVFLYQSIWNLLVFVILLLIHYSHSKKLGVGFLTDGKVFAFYLILYSLGRFFIEFLRINPQSMFFGLRLAQVMAILMFIAGWLISLRRKSGQLKKFNP